MLRQIYDLIMDPYRNPLISLLFSVQPARRARQRAVSHRDAMRDPRDATVLYDDIWGAP